MKVRFPLMAVEEFISQIARPVPTLPAGGSASALSGAVAAGLMEFVARVGAQRREDPERREALLDMARQLEKSRIKCLDLMDQDAAAYEKIICALEKTGNHRKTALTEASIEAIAPLTALAAEMRFLLETHATLSPQLHPPTGPDAEAAAHMAYGAFSASLALARANLSGIADPDGAHRSEKAIDDLQQQGREVYRKTIPEENQKNSGKKIQSLT